MWTILQKKPLIICDVAHNKEGLQSVFNQLRKEKKNKHIILGFSSDKNLIDIFKEIKLDAKYYFCSSSNPRIVHPETYTSLIKSLNQKYFIFNNSMSVLENLLNNIPDDDLIFITGSTFIVADVLSNFR